MLVKRSIVEQWYKTNSWVYKNFSYLFQNPLWDVNIPKGFSVCPYFWLSIFSILIFKPFVMFLTRIVAPLGRMIGSPLKAADKFIITQLKNRIIGLKESYNSPPLPGLAIVVLASGLFLLFLFYNVIEITIQCVAKEAMPIYHALIQPSPVYMEFFWASVSFIGMLILLTLHGFMHGKYRLCKPSMYFVCWGVLFISSLFIFIPHQVINFFISVGSFFIHGICNLILNVGFGIGTSASWLYVKVLAPCTIIVGIFLWHLITFCPIPSIYIPWWVYGLAFLAVCYFGITGFDYILKKLEKYIPVDATYKITQDEIEARNYRDWVNNITDVILMNDYWKNIVTKRLDIPEGSWCAYSINQNIIKRGVQKYYKEALKELSKFTFLGMSFVYRIKLKNIRHTDSRLYDFYCDVIRKNKMYLDESGTWPYWDHDNFMKDINIICEEIEIKTQFTYIVKQYQKDCKRKEDKQKVKLDTWHYKLCLQATTSIKDLFNKLIVKLGHMCCVAGRIICAIGIGIWFVIKQSGIFITYLWMFLVAYKHGVCPYITFSEPSTEKDKQTDSKNSTK